MARVEVGLGVRGDIIKTMRGKFITIYGINNIGKSTQAKRLVERLRGMGKKVEYVKYPVYDLEPTGPMLNKVLRGGEQEISEKELQELFVQNRRDFEPKLREWLEDGVIVIAEDYIGTGMAWGMAKGLSEEFVEEINEGLLVEDLAVLFEGTRDPAAMEEGHVHEQNDELVERCAEVHRRLCEKYGWKKVEVSDDWDVTEERLWKVVSGNEN